MDMDRFNPKKLNEGEVKEQYYVTIKNRFPVLENLEDNGDINMHGTLLERIYKFL
jgi:hypothetical protein